MKKFVAGLMAAGLFMFVCGISFAADCNYVASKGSNKYHLTDCGIAKNIKAENKVCFATQDEAVKAGYSPCGVCKPDENVKVVGSKGSDKYHLPECGIAKNIKKENLVEFKNPEEAVKAGYSPCGVCKPPMPKAAAETVKKTDK